MKRLILIALLLPSIAFAMTSEYVINTISQYTGTKSATATVDYTTPILITTPSSGVSFKINGAGIAVPISANIAYKYQPGGSVSSLVFSQSSSASPFSVFVIK